MSSNHFSSAHDTGNVCLPDNRLKYELAFTGTKYVRKTISSYISFHMNSMYVKDVSEYGRVGGGKRGLLSCNLTFILICVLSLLFVMLPHFGLCC